MASEMTFRNPEMLMGTDPEQSELERPVCDSTAIRAIVDTASAVR